MKRLMIEMRIDCETASGSDIGHVLTRLAHDLRDYKADDLVGYRKHLESTAGVLDAAIHDDDGEES